MENLKIPARVDYSDQPVLTTEQLAEFYECNNTQIKQNFNNNKDRFVEGKHYFKLEGAALKDFKSLVENLDQPISKFAPVLYLWTKQGAARHAKMLNTDKAWEVYEALEENYFTPKEKPAVAAANPATVADDTISLEKKIDALLRGAELTNLDRLRNSLIREAAFILTGKKF